MLRNPICDLLKLNPSSEKCNTDKTSPDYKYRRMCPVSCGDCQKTVMLPTEDDLVEYTTTVMPTTKMI